MSEPFLGWEPLEATIRDRFPSIATITCTRQQGSAESQVLLLVLQPEAGAPPCPVLLPRREAFQDSFEPAGITPEIVCVTLREELAQLQEPDQPVRLRVYLYGPKSQPLGSRVIRVQPEDLPDDPRPGSGLVRQNLASLLAQPDMPTPDDPATVAWLHVLDQIARRSEAVLDMLFNGTGRLVRLQNEHLAAMGQALSDQANRQVSVANANAQREREARASIDAELELVRQRLREQQEAGTPQATAEIAREALDKGAGLAERVLGAFGLDAAAASNPLIAWIRSDPRLKAALADPNVQARLNDPNFRTMLTDAMVALADPNVQIPPQEPPPQEASP
jgi:hypothetical protein